MIQYGLMAIVGKNEVDLEILGMEKAMTRWVSPEVPPMR
jgi:hypothetical protein